MSERTPDRLLYVLKSAGPQTAAALAARLGITAAGTRQHLGALAQAGLVAFADRRGGVGRPKRQWQLTASGHARFPDNHATLTLELLRGVGAVFGDAGLEQLILHREAAMLASYRTGVGRCRGVAAKVAALAALRDAEGYMAGWSAESDGSFMLTENHCPICAAARDCQALCRSELAMFATLFAGTASVARTDHIVAGARRCAYRIVTTGRAGSPASPPAPADAYSPDRPRPRRPRHRAG